MDGFQRRRQQKRESILRAALDLFKVHGIRRVSLAEIAAKARVSPVTIYNYFGSKQNLVREVIKWLASSSSSYYQSILKGDAPYLERLRRVLSEKSRTARAYQIEVFQLLFSDDPDIKAYIEELWPRANDVILDFFEEGQREGYISVDIPRETFLLYAEALRILIYRHSDLFLGDSEESQRVMQGIIRIYLYGLLGKEAYPELLDSARAGEQEYDPSQA